MLSEEDEKKFDDILSKATQKLARERIAAPQESKTKRVAKAIGRFLMDISSFGLWRLLKTPTAKVQFARLVKYSKQLVRKERDEKSNVFPRPELGSTHKGETNKEKQREAKKFGEAQYKEYLQVLNAQVANRTYNSADATKARENKLKKIKNEFDKLKIVDIGEEKIKLDTKENEIARATFNLLVIKRKHRVNAAEKSIQKLGKETKNIVSKGAETQNYILLNVNNATKQLRENVQRANAKVDVMCIPTEFGRQDEQQLRNMVAYLDNTLSSSKLLKNLERELKRLEGEMITMQKLATKKEQDRDRFVAMGNEINNIRKKQNLSGEILISEADLKAREDEIRVASNTVKAEQAQLRHEREALSMEIRSHRRTLAKIQKKSFIEKHKAKLEGLLKNIEYDKKNKGEKEKFYDSLKKALTQNIMPTSSFVFGDYTEQRDVVVDLIVQKYAEAFKKKSMVTSDYIIKNQKK